MHQPRRRGRPKGSGTEQRSHLLEAARELIGRGPGGDPSLAQVARYAGVTPALAHYYFGDRDGLVGALFAEVLGPMVEEVLQGARARAQQPQQAITALLQRLCTLQASEPLFRRCMWTSLPAARELRARLRAGLRHLILHAQDMRALRGDLPADYLAETLLGLALFHFLDDLPASAEGNDAIAALMLQHIALLRDGIVRPAG
jgi:AcrR family transcriptional regulator